MSHTPGPWKAYIALRNGDSGNDGWDINGPPSPIPQGFTYFNEADARLIAAAPELAEALREVTTLFNNKGQWIGGPDATQNEMLPRWQALLAKATGD